MQKFYLLDHQGKGWPYAQALVNAGWSRSEDLSDPDVRLALFDHDVGEGGRGMRPQLSNLSERGVAVLMYPHAARPMLQWDGMYPIWPHTRACVTIADGHREVMAAYGYPLPVEPCGWVMCEQKPWRPTSGSKPIEVLFGPIHPNHNGWMHPVDRANNTLLFHKLLETPGIHLTVRHIMRLDINGLWEAPGVKYIVANPNGKTTEIDQADVVIGHQTFAYLAVARGKPLVMFGDDATPHSGNTRDNLRWAASYDKYHELMRYPIEAEAARSGKDLRILIERAMGEDAGASWREKFIGDPLDTEHFVKTIERYL